MRPPTSGTANANRKRSVAPASPGAATSQNSWLVVKRKPACGSIVASVLHIIQTANASISAATDSPRLRRATRSPSVCQKKGLSGSQRASCTIMDERCVGRIRGSSRTRCGAGRTTS